MKPQDSLRQSADVFEERGKVYGDAYKNFGHVLMALRPNGFAIRNIEDANRLGVLTQIVMKIVRYANQFEAGGHDDSLLDLSTYAAMLRELDAEGRAKFEVPFPFELNESRASFEPKPEQQFREFGNPSTDHLPARSRHKDWKPEVEIEPVVPRRQTDFEKEVEAQARREMTRE
jgi:hypothetical protein